MTTSILHTVVNMVYWSVGSILQSTPDMLLIQSYQERKSEERVGGRERERKKDVERYIVKKYHTFFYLKRTTYVTLYFFI